MRRHYQRNNGSDRQQTFLPICQTTPMRSFFVVITVFSLLFLLYPKVSNKNSNRDSANHLPNLGNSLSRNISGAKSNHRLAIIIPFIGQGFDAIPPYLELFCTTAAGSARLVDFLIFHDGVFGVTAGTNNFGCPDNVIFHSLESLEEFSYTLVRIMDRKSEEELQLGGSLDKLASIVAKFIRKYPYVMVEFKPALGHIFEKYLEGYSHWGYSDLDVMIGDLERWITPDEVNDFDIVTYGFGDQNRLYLRGQFTFHRNDPEIINQIWRECDYLSHMDKRLANVLLGHKSMRLESAEGCYSAAVLKRDDIKVKYAVKAFTDVKQHNEMEGKGTAHTHGIYVGTGNKKNKTIIYKSRTDRRKGLLTVPYDWFEIKGSVYANPKESLYSPIGERKLLPINEREGIKCMYWVQEKYQSRLCVDGVDVTDTIYWINGNLYKEKFAVANLPGDIVTAPFFHFQEWKRYYRRAQLGGFRRDGPCTSFVLVKDGILPIYTTDADNYRKRSRIEEELISSPLDHSSFPMHEVKINDREQLPKRLYCLQATPKERPPTTRCNFGTSWQDSGNVEILSASPDWSTVNINLEVTIALTLQLHSEQLNDTDGFFQILAQYLNHWQGRPIVLVIHVAGATQLLKAKMRSKLGPGSDLSKFGMGSVLVGAIFSEKPDIISRKALMNMAVDAAKTRFVLSGYELERGIVPSLDTVYIAHRVAQIHKDSSGSVYIIPQFGLLNGTHDFTVSGLEKAHADGNLNSISKVDEGECENPSTETKESGPFGIIENIWWQLTRRDLNRKDKNGLSVVEHALALESIQSKVAMLLSEKEQYTLYATNQSPILLVDNVGPHEGMTTSEMVREVDEFGGKVCYNSMRFAQLATLGYRINILPGAFAISTPTLRELIEDSSAGPLGVSRCDGCYFFTKERVHEDILENISFEERQRPAKISILH